MGPLLAAGAAGDNGFDVVVHSRTTLPGIFAIGGCAAHADHFAGGQVMRVKSVQNASDQEKVAATTIMESRRS